MFCSAFQTLVASQSPPPRRITVDDAPTSMMQVPAANSHAQAAAQVQAQAQAHFSQLSHSHSAKGSVASFGSAGGGHARKKTRLA